MIKAIIFDCFGVLTVDRWLEFCDHITDIEAREEARRWNYMYDSGQVSLNEFLDEVVKLTHSDRQALADIFTNPKAAKNNELLSYIRELKPSFKIGMLSNVATNWVREEFLTSDEQRLFDAMVFSFEVGAGKPDRKMYTSILNSLGVRPDESVFIDDLQRYIEGAKNLGINTILYRDFNQTKRELENLLSAGPDN